MLQLRLEVVSSEHPNELCTQAARLASHIGVQVVFEHNGKDITAKPGMDAASLLHECLAEPAEGKKGKQPKDPKEPKAPKEPKPADQTTPTIPAAENAVKQ